jgi:hypothetical protein
MLSREYTSRASQCTVELTAELTVEIYKSADLGAGVQDTVEQTNTFRFSYPASILQSTSLPKLIASYID